MGTNHLTIRSAYLWTGALEAWASSTRCTICDRAVSSPTRVAVIVKTPVLLIVAPITSFPTVFSTGMLSPVRSFSSTDEYPAVTVPSMGIFSPGLTRITSPTCTWSIDMSVSLPSFMTRAIVGCSSRSLRIEAAERRRINSSMYLPSSTKARMPMATSR
jgi:hypothetical protein